MKTDKVLDPQYRQMVKEFGERHRTGVLTLFFSDLVGSTKLKQQKGDAGGTALIRRHQQVVRDLLKGFPQAQEISTAGDSFFIAFIRPSGAVRFALKLHAALRDLSSELKIALLLRAGLHMGEVFIERKEGTEDTHDLYGLQVDTAARVMGLATGGQTLMTQAVFDNARAVMHGEQVAGLSNLLWYNHGPYKVKGVEEPITICEAGEEGMAPLTRPENSDKAFRHISEDQEVVLGWRPSVDDAVGDTEWVLEKKLGEGSFGEVWLGKHKSLKDLRVFKFCFKADKVRSLKREVTLFRLLREKVGDHPGTVKIYDVYFKEPPYYIVMEYVDGAGLDQWLEEQGGTEAVPLETRLYIVRKAAEALDAAHKAGVLHRDIKPSNILISGRADDPENLIVKITDFGIGQITSQDALDGMTASGFTMTGAGDTSSKGGTQMYMAPETIGGGKATPAADVYSLGVVLYQLLLGDLHRPVTTDWKKWVSRSRVEG